METLSLYWIPALTVGLAYIPQCAVRSLVPGFFGTVALSIGVPSCHIRHRLTVAGGDAELFEDAACDLIYSYTGGIPRLVNTMCDMSLVYAFAEGVSRISVDQVEAVAKDRQVGGILPISINRARQDDRESARTDTDNAKGGTRSGLSLDKQIGSLLQDSANPLAGWVDLVLGQENPSQVKRLHRLIGDHLEANAGHSGLLLAQAVSLAILGAESDIEHADPLYKALHAVIKDRRVAPEEFENTVSRLINYSTANSAVYAAPLALALCKLSEDNLLPDGACPRAFCRSNLLQDDLAEAVVATYACADAVNQLSHAVENTMRRWASVTDNNLLEAVK
ncbi:MAG: hypothetical protein O3A84_04340 [Proteobacteria bacterium]|nr:hypothetical protein [Pseudomonadota bacterium]